MPRSTRSAHPERDVEKRDEAKVGPVGAFEDEAVTERASECVSRDKDPLRTRAMCRAETSELGDKWIHTISLPRFNEPELRVVLATEPRISYYDDWRKSRLFHFVHPAKIPHAGELCRSFALCSVEANYLAAQFDISPTRLRG